ncbi:RCC1 domain-containing protein [Planotetraspora mira]|uniref:RCC1 domain-containing protein n=1 Tax=Planotetraspora mira TaxID=58121 RepID=UPI001952034D|nr:putative Ig domain-containing protein [Planotetraspora mira]
MAVGLVLAVSAIGVAVSGPAAAVASSGTSSAYAWGNNVWGQLGNGSKNTNPATRPSPAAVHGLSDVTQVAAGDAHSLALRSDGIVWAWGRNWNGEVGGGPSGPVLEPARVYGLTDIVQVAAGEYYSLALRSDGTVWAWGYNTYGQLGDGSDTDRYGPVKVAGLTGVTQIAAGDFHSLALRSDGTVWAWGFNGLGGLGDGSGADRHAPVKVAGLTGVTRIAAGDYHSLALRSDGTMRAWGFNSDGQLGDGTTTDRYAPVKVAGLTGVTRIAAGDYHNLALRSDGTVMAWGNNASGQLGDGTVTQRRKPITVPGVTNIAQVSAGNEDSFALRSTGTVMAWGLNENGKLGDSTTTQRHKPITVPGVSSVTQVSAGAIHTLAKVGPPVVTAKAAITGSLVVGDKLTCKGTFLAASSVKYSWSRDTTTISGATASTYTPVAGDVGHKVTCTVSGTNTHGTTSTAAATGVYARFTTGTPPVAQTGKYFIYRFTASGYSTAKVALHSGALPPGLKLAAGGTLSGTPTQAGAYTFTLQATGGTAPTARGTKSVVVNGPAKFTTTTTPTAYAGKYYIYRFTTTGYPAPKVTLSSGTLPSGLKLATGGTLSGTATRKGTYTFTLKATNGVGAPATTTKTVTVR